MDEKVLSAQKWVNATYGKVVGFNKAPESGVTGWLTMYAFTRALQHEIGISTLSDSFGPTTMSKLAARGPDIAVTATANMIKIIQSACYCKGYDPGSIDGQFGTTTRGAINRLKSNAGLGDDGALTVTPKVLKALLTMDAYVVVAGGTDSVRAIQRWLNGRYLSRRDFFVIPCDGIFSRDVQRALYLAIQFELDMTDDQATGILARALDQA